MTKLATIIRVPLTADIMAALVTILKAEGYRVHGGLSKYAPQVATVQAFTKGSPLYGTLVKGQTFKWMDKGERAMFMAAWNGTSQPRTTKSETAKSGKATAKGRFVKGSPEAKAYMASIRAKRGNAGKAAPKDVKPQASGKLTEAEKLALVADTLSKLAQLLAS
jgi:hypothetical protein